MTGRFFESRIEFISNRWIELILKLEKTAYITFFLTHKSALQYNINLVNNIMPIGVIAIEFESFFVTTKDQFVR